MKDVPHPRCILCGEYRGRAAELGGRILDLTQQHVGCHAERDELAGKLATLRAALNRARREGSFSPHHCPGCDAATDETFYEEPAPHHPDCWLAAALGSSQAKEETGGPGR